MPIKDFMSDKVALVKQDGTRIEGIGAQVGKKIMISDNTLLIEEGDRILRTLPNGLVESYLVLDRGFVQPPRMSSIPAYYSMTVRKESAIPAVDSRSVVYNLYGANSRVNNQSLDASVNMVSTTPEDLFAKLREAIATQVAEESRKAELLEHVAEMEQARGTSSFVDKYKAFMSVLADHIGVVSPFLPALAQMLGG